MKKIDCKMNNVFYNNIIKKLSVSLCLIALLFVYITPIKSYAEIPTPGVEYTYTYNEWLSNQDKYDDAELRKSVITTVTITYIKDNIYEYITDDEEKEEKANKLLLDRRNSLFITGILDEYTYKHKIYTFTITGFRDKELKIDQLKKWVVEETQGNSTNGEIEYTYDEYKALIGEKDDEKVKEKLKEPIILYIFVKLEELGLVAKMNDEEFIGFSWIFYTQYDDIFSKNKEFIKIIVNDKKEIIRVEVPGILERVLRKRRYRFS